MNAWFSMHAQKQTYFIGQISESEKCEIPLETFLKANSLRIWIRIQILELMNEDLAAVYQNEIYQAKYWLSLFDRSMQHLTYFQLYTNILLPKIHSQLMSILIKH